MLDLKKDLGVQSYCFRGFKTVPALIEQVKGIGLDRMELCGVHADFNDEGKFGQVAEEIRGAGIAITSIGVQTFKGEEREEMWFKCAQIAGAKMISVTFDVARALESPALFAKVQKLAEQYDVVLGIHNHGGYNWLGNGRLLEYVLNTTGDRIGMCIDSAWCLQSGEDPVQWANQFGKKLFGVHIKDFVFDRAGKWTDVVVGEGNLKLKEFLAASLASPALRTLTLEYEGDVNDPGPKLRECVAAVRAAR